MQKAYYITKGLKGILKNILLFRGLRIPLFVHWSLTYKCNSQCKYCGVWRLENKELDLKSIFFIIDCFWRLGTIGFSLSGGEPLLRDDIKDIIDFIAKKKIFVTINSNGRLVPKKINDLKNVNRVKLSFDGPEEIHNQLRGDDSFETLCKATDALRENNIKFVFNTVISKYNLNHIDYILEFAHRLNTGVIFQPPTIGLLAINKERNLTVPDVNLYRKALDSLIAKKKSRIYFKVILNSLSSLHYLYNWPNITKIPCKAGIFFCHIDSDGTPYPCNWWRSGEEKRQFYQRDIKNIANFFYEMISPRCNQCWCELSDINFLFSLNMESIINMLRTKM